MLKKNLFIVFCSSYLFGCFLFSSTDVKSLTTINRYEIDVKLLKNEVGLLNLSDPIILPNTYESSIYDVKEVSSKKDDPAPIDIKTKTTSGKHSIFVKGFQAIRAFPARPRLNYYREVQDGINNLIDELAKGNPNPGTGNVPIGKGLTEYRHKKGGRVITRTRGNVIEILGKSGKDKTNQKFVINRVKSNLKQGLYD